MGVIRGGKAATAEYLRNLDRLIDDGPHKVYVIQEKRALRDYAKELGVEMNIGDPGVRQEEVRGGLARKKGLKASDVDPKKLAAGAKIEMEHTDDEKLARRIALDHLAEDINYYEKLKKVEKSQPFIVLDLEKAEGGGKEPNEPKDGDASKPPPAESVSKAPSPGSGGDGQKEGPDGERWPHKYLKRYKSPRGQWVYVYDIEGPKRTGFAKSPEPMPASPAIGKKRSEVAGKVKSRAQQAGGKAREQMFDFHQWVRNSMNIPESTQKTLASAVTYLGGGQKGMDELKKRHDDWMAKNPHIAHPEDQAFAGEMLAREVLAAHQQGEAGKEDPQAASRYAKRPGGFTPKDPNLRQPWQLTRDEFTARQGQDPKIQGKDYMQMLSSAAERGEYIPNHVLGQGGDEKFSEEMYDFKQKYLKEQKPEVEMSDETKAYVEKFDRLVSDLPKKFDGWVKNEVRREGDKYLSASKASGYNIDSYDVTDAGIYSHMMTAPETLVLYHQYAEHSDHGRELLAKLHEHGIDCEYTVIKRGSAVAWDNSWPDEAEMSYRETGGKDEKGRPQRIGYSSDYVLAFRPKDDKQAEDIAALLHEHAHAGEERFGAQPHQAIHRSWYVPDVRASKKIDGYGRAFLNVKTMGHQELSILTKNDFIKKGEFAAPASPAEARGGEGAEEDYDESFRREYVYVDQALHDVIKALRGYGKLGRGEVVIVEL